MSKEPGPLEQAAIDAHAERWAPQIAKQGGFVLGYITMQSGVSPDSCGLDGSALHLGPVVEDAPPRVRAGMLLMLGGFMALRAPNVLADADALHELVEEPEVPVTRYILTVRDEHVEELFSPSVTFTLAEMIEAGYVGVEKVTR